MLRKYPVILIVVGAFFMLVSFLRYQSLTAGGPDAAKHVTGISALLHNTLGPVGVLVFGLVVGAGLIGVGLQRQKQLRGER